jgi:signal transduction histidine kinase
VSTRWRIFLAAVVLVVLPAGILAGFFRARLLDTVSGEFLRRWRTVLVQDLSRVADESRDNRRRLELLAGAADDDNRLRLALTGERDDLRPYLRDYAGAVARTAALTFLELVDDRGTILSSAHYRNEFGASAAALLDALRARPNPPWPARSLASPALRAIQWLDIWPALDDRTLFTAERTPDGLEPAMVSHATFTVGERTYHLIGGTRAPALNLAVPGAPSWAGYRDLDVTTLTRDDLDAWGARTGNAWMAADVPYAAADGLRRALLMVHVDRAGLERQRAQVDQFLATVVVAVLAGAFALAAWLSGRLSRPLADLARRAEQVDLDRPEADLDTGRRDEVGQLARILAAMVARLRAGARRLADAERRATVGEVARQVNHDLRNGITPVRNVVRHLGETAERDPQRLAEVFRSRRGTLESSLAYLEDLAGRYARLAPERRREPCDLAALVREVAADQADVTVVTDADAPPVLGDPVSLRRILENLLRNAHEALRDDGGAITVRVARDDDPHLGPGCVLAVRDDGVGMAPEVRARVLEDFFTTKAGGSGLGLSNVRRLASDAGGRLEIESTPGAGTTVTIVFPAAEAAS